MRVALAGGGIVGICTAIALRERKIDVTVFEPEEPAVRTIGGSACYLSPGEIFPLAHPQVLRALPELLFSRSGPLVIRASHLPHLVGWGMRFLAAARPANVARGVAALSALNARANDATFALAHRAGANAYLERSGGIHVARDTATLKALRESADAIAAAGMRVEALDGAQLREREPALAPGLAGGLLLPGDARVRDPIRFGARLAAYLRELGGSIVRQRVDALVPAAGGGWSVSSSQDLFTHAIVTAGAWSHELLRPLGYTVPLDTERGYNVTLPEPGVALNHPLVFAESRIAMTPLDYGLRVTGTVEFAGLRAAPDWRRSDMLVRMAQDYLPGVRCEDATRWMGFRPALPDALPAIGGAARHGELFYAFGHEHLGFTQAAITAECVAALLAGEPPAVDLRPFDLERFHR